ncbi:MAG: enoyl-CoA hydratase/isomerase family protein [Dermatophilaceae bacterium]
MTDETSHPGLRVTREGAVQTVTLCNPRQRNAQMPSLWLALAAVARGLDPGVRVVVMQAEGPDFSAGLHRALLTPDGLAGEPNLLAMAGQGPQAMASEIARYQEGFTAWSAVPALVVAAVQGNAIGAGFQLALAADVRVLADDARFCMRETSLGMVPDLDGTTALVSAVGYSRALEICATGRFVAADEAVRLGLASLVVPRTALPGAVDDLVAALLATPAAALRELKPLLRDALSHDRAEQLRREREAQGRLFTRR